MDEIDLEELVVGEFPEAGQRLVKPVHGTIAMQCVDDVCTAWDGIGLAEKR